ncbi:MAG: UDP-N-acetylmuramoyl-tripeptide--D-alanyl-D-alanine ligase [Verrucomicrobiaceae bacterium]|nr:UDP-N-acetylmuramoyl-tripeptide--D-alanyl-D-alanine ligase [Verrucomicrobiaceae bacterium]
MRPLPLQTLADFCGGRLLQGDGQRLVTQISTDSRRVSEGDVFVALKGDRFDAHDYAAQVAASGASALIVSQPITDVPCAIIQVTDTLLALQNLARAYRASHNPLVVALTGSNGKTSTKDLTTAVLSKHFPLFATKGNLNNHIGLPLTLLSLRDEHTCAITEMGMNHAGEIKTLVDIARPDAAILTNVGHAHIEFLGSQENIAWEKATLPVNVPASGHVVLNADDAYTPRIARLCQAKVITAGIGSGDVSAQNLIASSTGTTFTLDFAGTRVDATLPLLGRHMVGNAALAAAMAWSLGMAPDAIADALNSAQLSGGRLEPKVLSGIHFLDDSYNANPDSMIAGLQTLAETAAPRRFAVLGAMGELGPHAAAGHAQVGEFAASLGLDGLFTVGTSDAARITDAARSASSTSVAHFPDHASCAAHLRELLLPGDLVLLKGSRSSAMEKILTHFQPVSA